MARSGAGAWVFMPYKTHAEPNGRTELTAGAVVQPGGRYPRTSSLANTPVAAPTSGPIT